MKKSEKKKATGAKVAACAARTTSTIRAIKLLAFLCVIFAVSMLTSSKTEAATTYDSTYIKLHAYYAKLNADERKVYADIVAGIENLKDEIIPSAKIKKDQLKDVLISIAYDRPDLFWFGGKDINSFASASGVDPVRAVQIAYNDYALDSKGNVSKTVRDANVKKLENAVSSIISGANKETTIANKELYVHHTLVKRISYDWKAYYINTNKEKAIREGKYVETVDNTIYHAIVDKTCACAGYSRSFQYIMTKLGIPCFYAIGTASTSTDSGDHAWNVVGIGSKYYAVDLTWDDCWKEQYLDSKGMMRSYAYDRIRLEFYNMTRSDMDKNHTFGEGLCARAMPALSTTDDFKSLYNRSREDSYLDTVTKDFDGKRIYSVNEFLAYTRSFYKQKTVTIKFAAIGKAVYNEIYRIANDNIIMDADVWRQIYNNWGVSAVTVNQELECNTACFTISWNLTVTTGLKTISGVDYYYNYKTESVINITRAVQFGDRYYYFTNGKFASTHTGIYIMKDSYTKEEKNYIFINGIYSGDYTGFVSSKSGYYNGRYKLIDNEIDTSYTGVSAEDGNRYYEKGVWKSSYKGYANPVGYVEKDSRIAYPYWYYIKDGVVQGGDGKTDWGYEGLYKDKNNVWRYYRYGKFQSTTTGFATDMTRYYSQKRVYRYRVEKGLVNFHFTGMAETGNARYYKEGRWMNTFTGNIRINGILYRIVNGTKK